MSIFRQQKAIERLEDRYVEVRADLELLKSANRSLELEFTELYDKVRHQMSRMAKRAAVVAKENGDDPDPQPASGDDEGIDPVSASILRRRGIRRQAT